MRTAKKFRGCDFTARDWLSLCESHGNRCACCGEQKKLTIDHIKPKAAGGTDDLFNIQPLCKSCNSKKNSSYEGMNYRYTGTQGGLAFHFRRACRKKAAREKRDIKLPLVAAEVGMPESRLRRAIATGGGILTCGELHTLCAYLGARRIGDLVEYYPDVTETA